MTEILAGFVLGFIFIILGFLFWPFFVLAPLAIIAGVIAKFVKNFIK